MNKEKNAYAFINKKNDYNFVEIPKAMSTNLSKILRRHYRFENDGAKNIDFI